VPTQEEMVKYLYEKALSDDARIAFGINACEYINAERDAAARRLDSINRKEEKPTRPLWNKGR
jgi:hypothetical protein